MLPILWATLTAGCVPVLESPDGGDEVPWAAPENGWYKGEPPEELEGEGFEPGQVVPDGAATDQFGDPVSLWQFHGAVWVLDVSTMWCSPCQELARGVQETADEYRDDGFVYVTVLLEDLEGDVPDAEELQEWGDAFGIETEPIVADDKGYGYAVVPDNAFPGLLVIDRDLRVHARISPPSDAGVRAAVEEIL